MSGLVDDMRLVKSSEEITLMRAAAKASDAGTQGTLTRSMQARIAEEHTSWGDGIYRDGEKVMLEVAGCVARYNAPMGRFVHIGHIKDEDAETAELSKRAFEGILDALKPGVRARDVYDGWQEVVNQAGLPKCRRHHCGYLVGIGFSPSWTGGNTVTGLRHDSDLEIKVGMTFHAMSWFTETGRGDYFVSNCVLLGPDGAELLTTTPMGPTVL